MGNVQAKEKEGEDRISSLPDCLIIDILSRLRFTKQAIRTGTLSKRWQHLWPSLPCLSFGDYAFKGFDDKKPLPDFYLAVDKTLTQCQSKNLIKFKVFANYDERFQSHVDNWIHFVTSRNVQQLYIFLMYEGYAKNQLVSEDDSFLVCHESLLYELKDDSFFENSNFTYLKLSGCLLKPAKPIIWNNLTNLIISNVKVDHDLIENILSGSPLLADLSLVNCYGYWWLDITSKSVERLVVDGYDDFVLQINAPYISSLTVEGDLWLYKLSLRDVSSLVKAKLDYHMIGYRGNPDLRKEEEEILNRLILNLRHVKELKIGIACYEVLAHLEVRGFIFPSNLKGVDVTSLLYSLAHSKALVDCRNINDSSDDSHSV